MSQMLCRQIAAFLAAGSLAAPALAEQPTPAGTPTLVAAYVDQLVQQCGGTLTPTLASQLIQRVDLNGDKLDDWVVDTSLYPCPTRPAAFADQGFDVMVFMGRADGKALPAFQRAAFGSRIEGTAAKGYSLSLTVSGRDCGEDNIKTRCDRGVVWRAKRLDLADLTVKAALRSTSSKK